VVFRSPNHRYLVHAVVRPIGEYRIPIDMDQPTPDDW
jgi:hypothetical protein